MSSTAELLRGNIAPAKKIGLAASVALGLLVALLPVGSANASAGHFNTDPYSTGCSKTAYTVTSAKVSGGTASIKYSRSCGTNWVEYRGNKQTTSKSGKDSKTNRWTRNEVDYQPWSYSMQSYAPGYTAYTGKIIVGKNVTTVSCASKCSWKTVTIGPRDLGGLDLKATCYRVYGGDKKWTYAELQGKTAGDWRCFRGFQAAPWLGPKWSGPYKMDLNEACRYKHGKRSYAKAKDWNNPYSWRCYI